MDLLKSAPPRVQQQSAFAAINTRQLKPALQPRGRPMAGGDVVQKKTIAYKNPYLTKEHKLPAAPGTMTGHVQSLSDAVDAEAATLNGEIQALKADPTRFVALATAWEGRAGNFGKNFATRVFEWGKGGAEPHKEAGYMMESAANVVAATAGLDTQVVIGNARPDFRIKNTTQTYNYDGTVYAPNGLVDATSQAEAAKGHIMGKLTKFPLDAHPHYPHLWDVYYDKIAFGAATVAIPLDGDIAKKVEAKALATKEQAEARKGSLRPRKANDMEEE